MKCRHRIAVCFGRGIRESIVTAARLKTRTTENEAGKSSETMTRYPGRSRHRHPSIAVMRVLSYIMSHAAFTLFLEDTAMIHSAPPQGKSRLYTAHGAAGRCGEES